MQEPQDSAQSEIAGKSGEEIIAYIKEKYDKFADETQNSVEALEIKFVLAAAGIGIDDPKETVDRLQDCVAYFKENIFPCTYLLRQRAIEYTRAQNTFIKSMNKFIKHLPYQA